MQVDDDQFVEPCIEIEVLEHLTIIGQFPKTFEVDHFILNVFVRIQVVLFLYGEVSAQSGLYEMGIFQRDPALPHHEVLLFLYVLGLEHSHVDLLVLPLFCQLCLRSGGGAPVVVML